MSQDPKQNPTPEKPSMARSEANATQIVLNTEPSFLAFGNGNFSVSFWFYIVLKFLGCASHVRIASIYDLQILI